MAAQPAGKSNLNTRHLLQNDLRVDDKVWDFSVPTLPNPGQVATAGLVKLVQVSNSAVEPGISLTFQKVEENRAIRGDPLDRFLLVSFSNLRARPQQPSAQDAMRPSTAKDCADYIERLLSAGISIQGIRYNFYGHSNSQLKSRSCFLYAAPKNVVAGKIEALGELGGIKTVAKKAKRIGLLFSTARVALTVSPDRVKDIGDVESGHYIFTDGCGLIAKHMAQELARRTRIVFRSTRYTPSVFQIRYRGYKGVVIVDPTSSDPKVLLRLPKSMRKFDGGDDHSFSVVEYSKPYSFGFLNDEVVVLLEALGIGRQMILQKQQEHFEFLASATRDARQAFRFLSYVGRPDLAEKVLVESLESVQQKVSSLVKAEYSKMLNKRDEQKCRIFIPKSRLLFGVCDAWKVLKEGECFVRVTSDDDGVAHTLIGADVLVTRNPCLHPGDLQKFRTVDRPELAHLVDCIVFSTRGKRPAADMMSGGDLDGDTFFVCWDKDLIPSKLSEPAQYPGAREPVQFKAITDEDRLNYFARYNNTSLGRVKSLYLDWARVEGPMSPQCQELNRLFSQCVDGNRIRIPPHLKECPAPTPDTPAFILDVLHDAAMQLIQQAQNIIRSIDYYDFHIVELLLSRENVAMTEFELICMTQRWCCRNQIPLASLLHLFDFNAMTASEKAWVLRQVPASIATPDLVLNAINTSELLSQEETRHFRLNHHSIHWKRMFSSSYERMGTFLDTCTKTMTLFHRKLVVVHINERLTVAIYVPAKMKTAQECTVDDSVYVFAFAHSQGPERQSRLALPTKKTYRLYCDGGTFQLYEGKRANTWIFLRRAENNDTEYRRVKNNGDRRRLREQTVEQGVNHEVVASIALDKFSQGLQRHVGRVNRYGVMAAEIYVISNRDVHSMRALDLWLEHIDTVEKMPLFDAKAEEYTVPNVSGVVWDSEPVFITAVARDHNVASLRDIKTLEDFETLFRWLFDRSQTEPLLKCFDYLLSTVAGGHPLGVERSGLFQVLVGFLQKAPYLATSFARIGTIDEKAAEIEVHLESAAAQILRAFILSANDAHDLIIRPFQSILSRLSSLSVNRFAELIELVGLTVRDAEVAMNLLLECLEPASDRLLTGSPAVVKHLVRNTIAIALNHIGEAGEQLKPRDDLIMLTSCPETDDGCELVEARFRIDAPDGIPQASTHVRLTVASLPANAPLIKKCSIDALVTRSGQGVAKFQCLHPQPPYYDRCSWKMDVCGPYATTKTMFDAMKAFATECTPLRDALLGLPCEAESEFAGDAPVHQPRDHLNASQNAAVKAALTSKLTCLWGPPGTGKTETIVQIIRALQTAFPEERILVTAPTHNAVDNVLRRYLGHLAKETSPETRILPLRVSTEVRKVADDLRLYTCDAMAGAEIHSSHTAMKDAQKRVKNARIIFTTCIGAGLGLLRTQQFDAVVVDEASQQTEPASLVPLVKGCGRAVLVGDHVQLRPTVHPGTLAVEFDVSLFERLFVAGKQGGRDGIERVMLDTQYRMHEDICRFSSEEFYDGKLRTGVPRDGRSLPASKFPWPLFRGQDGVTEAARMVWMECSAPEALFQKSKTNKGQADLCVRVCRLLCMPAAAHDQSAGLLDCQTVAVLTPYAAQAELLKRSLAGLAGVEVSSIDGFQGREADVVVFVTVRCNPSCEMGFLKDMRRMNVALTRARAGVVVIGHGETLTGGMGDAESAAVWGRLVKGLTRVVLED